MARKTENVAAGSGDVFQDLGCKDAAERRLRVQPALRVNDFIKKRKLPRAKVSALFGIPQPHVSELKHLKLSRFSSEPLMHFITLLDRDIEILIRPKASPQTPGAVSVLLAV
jgi:predicted XRE-type DNA-binding protein